MKNRKKAEKQFQDRRKERAESLIRKGQLLGKPGGNQPLALEETEG